MPVALFGITNSGLSLFVNLLILFLVVVWLALIAWTYLDARRRISDPVLIACATGASLFPFVGTIIYAILRPPEFIEDARERDLEIRASQLRVRQLQEQSCPNCEFPIERTYLRCPNCRVRVKDPCASCGKPIDPRWTLCPYCETPVRHAEPAPRRAASGTRAERAPSRGPAPERMPSPSTRPRKAAERAPRTAAAGDRASASRSPTRSSTSRSATGDRAPSRSANSGSSTSSAPPRSGRREPSGDRPAAPASES